jgi:hypothetical protein
MYTDVMIDIETLGKRPGCVVASIGYAAFRRYGLINGPADIKSGRVLLAIEPQVCRGFEVDADTMMWWMNQSAAARDDWATPEAQAGAHLPSVAMAHLSKWIADQCYASFWVWGNSPQFDLAILAPIWKAAGVQPPWSYAQERDIRTLGAVFSDVKRPQPALAHRAADDAVAQAEWVQNIFAHISGKPYGTSLAADPASSSPVLGDVAP